MTMKRNLIGHRFERLAVISEAPTHNGKARWNVRCDCGGEKAVFANALVSGLTKSCGCLNRESIASVGRRNLKHGGGTSPEYRSYSMMRVRCLVPHNSSYPDYGGRGIKICDRWLEGFTNFLADMGPRPKGTTLDRIDNNGNYEPANCRWATREQQAQNTRTARPETIDGVTKPLREWIAESPMERSTIYKRLKRGVPLEQALRP